MAETLILSLDDRKHWNDLIWTICSERRDIYYLADHYRIYSMLGEGEAYCFIYKSGDDLAAYPHLRNSVNKAGYDINEEYYDIQGAYGYNGVVSTTDSPDFIAGFYSAFEAYCQETNIIAEFTRFHPLLNNFNFSFNNMQVILDRETVALDLRNSYEEIWANEYSSKNRNMIRKAIKLGYYSELIPNPSRRQIAEFKTVYKNSMSNVQADSYYYFNDVYYQNIFDSYKEKAYLLNLYNADHQTVCSAIFLNSLNFFHYHLSGRSTLADNSTNNFLLDEAIKHAQNLGCEMFHFGGGKSGDPNDSLLKFKSSFSTCRKQFYIGKKVHNETIYNQVISQWESKLDKKPGILNKNLLRYRS